MARKKIIEQTEVEPVVAPEPESATAHPVSTGTAKRPQDQDGQEQMTRAEKIAAVVNEMIAMDEESVDKVLAAIPQKNPEDADAQPEEAPDVIPDDSAVINHASILAKEHADVMFAGEDLSESFTRKATTLLQAAYVKMHESVSEELMCELTEQFESEFTAEVDRLEEQVDAYITECARTYISENKLAVENGIKSDLYENMIVDLSQVLKGYNVAIRDDQVDLLEKAHAEAADLKEQLNAALHENLNTKANVNELQKALVFEAATADLTLPQKHELRSLIETVDVESPAEMEEKLITLKEGFIGSNSDSSSEEPFYLSEEVEIHEEDKYNHMDPSVSAYVQAVSKDVKRRR